MRTFQHLYQPTEHDWMSWLPLSLNYLVCCPYFIKKFINEKFSQAWSRLEHLAETSLKVVFLKLVYREPLSSIILEPAENRSLHAIPMLTCFLGSCVQLNNIRELAGWLWTSVFGKIAWSIVSHNHKLISNLQLTILKHTWDVVFVTLIQPLFSKLEYK